MTDGSIEHPGELLSALADGELDRVERAGVDRHLAECVTCSHEFDLIQRSRAALLALPELEPPTDFIERIVRRRHQLILRGSLGGCAVAMFAAVLLLTADPRPAAAVDPELASFASDHTTTAVTAPDAPTITSTTSFGRVQVDNEVAGFDLIAVSERDHVVHAMYRRDQRVVSVFQQSGVVDWESLPGDGRRLVVGGRDGWQAADASSTVLDADGVVLTFVGDPDAQEALAGEVGETPSPSWWDRAHDAAQSVLGGFDFG